MFVNLGREVVCVETLPSTGCLCSRRGSPPQVLILASTGYDVRPSARPQGVTRPRREFPMKSSRRFPVAKA